MDFPQFRQFVRVRQSKSHAIDASKKFDYISGPTRKINTAVKIMLTDYLEILYGDYGKELCVK